MLVRFTLVLLGSFLIFGGVAHAKDYAVKSDLMIGFYKLNPKVSAQKAAEYAEKLNKADSNFSNLTVGEIDKDVFGIFFTYKSHDKMNHPDKLAELGTTVLGQRGKDKDYVGHSISNSTIVIK